MGKPQFTIKEVFQMRLQGAVQELCDKGEGSIKKGMETLAEQLGLEIADIEVKVSITHFCQLREK